MLEGVAVATFKSEFAVANDERIVVAHEKVVGGSSLNRRAILESPACRAISSVG